MSSGALLLSSCKKYQSLRGPSIYKNQALGVGPLLLSCKYTALNSLSLLRSNSGQTRDICKVADLRIIRIFLFEKFCHKRILAQRSWIFSHYAWCVNALWQHDFFHLKWITLDEKLKCKTNNLKSKWSSLVILGFLNLGYRKDSTSRCWSRWSSVLFSSEQNQNAKNQHPSMHLCILIQGSGQSKSCM